MSNVFNFNNYNLSKDEVIKYADNGTIDAIPSDIFMKIIKEFQSGIDEAESESCYQDYETGYDDGWEAAIEEMKTNLERM